VGAVDVVGRDRQDDTGGHRHPDRDVPPWRVDDSTAGAVVLGRPGRLGRRVSAIPILSAAAVSAKVGSADQWSWERAIVAAAKPTQPPTKARVRPCSTSPR
jgi:hypothetical protein